MAIPYIDAIKKILATSRKRGTSAKTCACCGDLLRTDARQFLNDSAGRQTAAYQCGRCLCYTACGANPCATDKRAILEAQTTFHERWWGNETLSSTNQAADELQSVVDFCERKGFLNKSNCASQNILELGAGRGCLLKALRQRGYPARGSDPARELVEKSRERFGFDDNVFANETAEGTIQRLTVTRFNADAIFLWHVLEHVPQPLQLLMSLHAILKNSGLIIAQVPMLDSRYLYAEHLFLFSRPSAERIAFLSSLTCIYADVDPPTNFLTLVLKKDRDLKPVPYTP
jgi:2-polyprenyl-3-methyl-5-hydroxy-6-metoxy-1,4-benzoquinol methylase